DRGRPVAPSKRAGEQIFLDAEMAEAVAALHHLDAAAAHHLVRREPLNLGAVEHDRALGHFAALGMQQIGDRLQRGGLAGAVCSEQRHDAAVRHRERYALEHENDAVVDHFDIIERENRRGICCRYRRGHRRSGGSHRRFLPVFQERSIVAREAGGTRAPGSARPSSLCIQLLTVPLPRAARESAYEDLSQGSVRLGQPVLAFTYSSAVLLISGRTLSLIGWIEGTTVFHFVPSHWTREMPL